MKRILTFLLCIALAVSMLGLVSCSDEDAKTVEKLDGKTPEELYEFSQQKLKEAKAYHVLSTQDIVISATVNGETESMTMKQTVESKINGDNSYVKTSNSEESSASMEAWYVDGVVYTTVAGAKIKKEISKDKYMQQYMGTDPSESTLLDIPESWFKDIKFEKEENSWVINFTVSGEKYTEAFGNIGLDSASINGDVSYKIYFDKNGNIEKLAASFDMQVYGASAHCDSISTITIGDVEVTAPEDADSYVSMPSIFN